MADSAFVPSAPDRMLSPPLGTAGTDHCREYCTGKRILTWGGSSTRLRKLAVVVGCDFGFGFAIIVRLPAILSPALPQPENSAKHNEI